ncbi:hypothetical protein L195_g022604 [Trifolium pratense]|uniref:Uncharacterized protein n=1 Tax=Trifolium pratense TaxID=57577 RepID=A0A2K3MDL4_TRIPR|nr:hypothetical protein L195_g040330 [Trifolium pratense]PNX88881.1 hypothetical protein L195_g044995 [Trifolium pratense]PNX99339.1 hypothetical protein L195_g022604 [Trifolium pratense]
MPEHLQMGGSLLGALTFECKDVHSTADPAIRLDVEAYHASGDTTSAHASDDDQVSKLNDHITDIVDSLAYPTDLSASSEHELDRRSNTTPSKMSTTEQMPDDLLKSQLSSIRIIKKENHN